MSTQIAGKLPKSSDSAYELLGYSMVKIEGKGIMLLAKLLDGVERRDGYRDKVHGIPQLSVKFSNV